MHPQGNRQTSSELWLRRHDLLNFIDTLYKGDLHAKRVLSLANATLGVLTSASLAIHAVGRGLAQAMGTLTKHGVKQVDRLLSNRGIDVWTFFDYWTPYLIGARSEVVVALDWTSFAADEQETIVLSMLTGHGRATPLLWKTVASSTLKDNQRRYEYEVLCRLREVLPDGVKVTIVADRGFAGCKLFYALTTELGFEYVIRLRGDVYVTNARGERRVAAEWVGAGGRARRLVGARVTDVHDCPQREADRARPLGVGERLGAIELLAHVVGDGRIEVSFCVGEPVRHGVGDSLRKQRPAVELQQPLLDHAPHQVRDVGRVVPVAEAAFEAVAVEQGEEELEVLLFAVVRRRRQQQEVAGQARQELPEAVALRVLDLAAEEGRRQLVRLVAHDQVPAGVGRLQLLLHVLVARQLVEAGDDQVGLQEPVAGAGGFELVVGEDLERKLEPAVELVLPLFGEAAGADDEATLQVAARDQLLDEQAGHDVLAGYSRFRRYTPRMLRTLDIEASPVAKGPPGHGAGRLGAPGGPGHRALGARGGSRRS